MDDQGHIDLSLVLIVWLWMLYKKYEKGNVTHNLLAMRKSDTLLIAKSSRYKWVLQLINLTDQMQWK